MASVSAAPSLPFHTPILPGKRAAQWLRSTIFSPLGNNIGPCLAKRRTNSAVWPKFSVRAVAASKQAYICRDCGYIYNDRTPFDKLPDKYFCPVCGAPKRRFRTYDQSVSKNDNQLDVRKARKAQIQKDEAIGKVLPIAAAVGVVALVALYLYLNSAY